MTQLATPAGRPPANPRRVVESLQRVAEHHRRLDLPTYVEASGRDGSLASPQDVLRAFRTWSDAKDAAGLPTARGRRPGFKTTREQAVAAVRRCHSWHEEKERAPVAVLRRRDYQRYYESVPGEPSLATITAIEKWSGLVRECGCVPGRSPNLKSPSRALPAWALEPVARMRDELGQWPTARHWDAHKPLGAPGYEALVDTAKNWASVEAQAARTFPPAAAVAA